MERGGVPLTAAEVLNRVLQAGGEIVPDRERPRLRVPRKPRDLKPLVEAHRTDLRALVCQSFALADAYRTYWTLPETGTVETFQGVYREIIRLEAQTPPEIAWRTLREAATAYHTEKGTCPFCRTRGELHLPAEQIDRELSEHGKAERG